MSEGVRGAHFLLPNKEVTGEAVRSSPTYVPAQRMSKSS